MFELLDKYPILMLLFIVLEGVVLISLLKYIEKRGWIDPIELPTPYEYYLLHDDDEDQNNTKKSSKKIQSN